MNYSFHPSGQEELYDGVEYYNKIEVGLGIEFVKEVYKTIQIILQFPQAGSPLSKNSKRCLVNRFPYGVIYQHQKDEIFIIAVMHLNKKPNYWHQRIKQDRTKEST